MKNSRFSWGMLVPLALFVTVAISMVHASKRATGQLPDKSQGQEKANQLVMWKPTTMALQSSGSNVDLNLRALAGKADWVVGVVPVETGGKEELIVSRLQWEDTGANNNYKIERVVKAEGYPNELVDIASGTVTITGSDDLARGDTTLVICLKVAPTTQVNLLQDGLPMADSSKSLQRRFAIKNGKPLGTPTTSWPMLLAQLQTDRISESTGREVTVDQTKADSQRSVTPSSESLNCTFSGTSSINGNCFDISMNLSCDDGSSCSIQVGGCDWGTVSATYSVIICSDD